MLAFALLWQYADRRFGEDVARYSIVCMVVHPCSFFLLAAYSESMMLLLSLCVFLMLEYQFSKLAIAMVIGLATACRPVGSALLIPFALYLYQQHKPQNNLVVTVRHLVGQACFLVVGVWGLLAFMAFQYARFGTPLAFVQTQTNYRVHSNPESLFAFDKFMSLGAFQPFWANFVPSSDSYWRTIDDTSRYAEFSLQFANPVIFGVVCLACACGIRRKSLNATEFWYAFGLLLIPYVTRAHEMAMASHGRFSLIVFPAAIVFGQACTQSRSEITWLLIFASALLLTCYTISWCDWGFII